MKIRKMNLYQVNPRFFKDKTNNGVGDLGGLIQKFDYFSYLQVDAIILHDVICKGQEASFTDIDPAIGTMKDFESLIKVAKKHKKGIFIELNIGSISNQNKWYKNKEDFKKIVEFLDKEKREKVSNSREISLDSQEEDKYFVVDNSTREVPLNWKTDEVLNRFVDIVEFWYKKGVSGFVIKNFEFITDSFKVDMIPEESLLQLRKFYTKVKTINKNIFLIGTSSKLSFQKSHELIDEDKKVFDYFLNKRLSQLANHRKFGTDKIAYLKPRKLVKVLKCAGTSNQSIVAFSTPKVSRLVSRWGDEHQYRNEAAKSLAMLMLLTNGSAAIYYGDELGATNIGLNHLDDFQDPTLAVRRTAAAKSRLSAKNFYDAQVRQNPINAKSLMAWNNTKNGGFSTSKSTIIKPSYNIKEINVENQFKDPNSVLNFYKQLIQFNTLSKYAQVFENGIYSFWPLTWRLIKFKVKHQETTLVGYINLTQSTCNLWPWRAKGQVIVSSFNKKYLEVPSKLEVYESIIVEVKKQDKLKLSHQEKEVVKEVESEMEHVHDLQKEVIVDHGTTHELKNIKQKVKTEKKQAKNYEEQTQLTDDEIAKTILINDPVEIEKMFEEENTKKRKRK